RVRIAALPPHAQVAGFAADDLSHLLAELLENATSASPPELPVEISGWLLENGEVVLSVQDEGIGMAAERLERLNARLTEVDPEAPFEQEEGEDGLGLGLYVVARLAHRYGARVRLSERKEGSGTAAVVALPESLLAQPPSAAAAPSAATADGTGAEAEDQLVAPAPAPAQEAVRRTEAAGEAGAAGDAEADTAAAGDTEAAGDAVAAEEVVQAGGSGDAGSTEDTGSTGEARSA
ncbi:ATP-binding protein, partial [Streptomyces sp. TRM76130]|nr:ATP-binding protein [Streptomyces sp. TRM76130]